MHCFIDGCPNGSDNPQKKPRMVTFFFTAPKEETLFRQWQLTIPRSGNRIYSRGDKLCDLHFKKAELILFSETKLPNGKVRRVPASEPILRPGTIPSIFPMFSRTGSETDKNKEAKTGTVSETQKSRGKRKLSTDESEAQESRSKRKLSTDDSESQETPKRPRGRPKKIVPEGNKKKITPLSEKRKKIDSDAETAETIEEKQYKEIESDDDSNEELSQAPSIRLVPLETLLAPSEDKEGKKEQQEASKGPSGNKKRKPISQNLSPPLSTKKKKVEEEKSVTPKAVIKPIESSKKVRENIKEVCAELEMALTDMSEDEGPYEIEHTTDIIDDEGNDFFEAVTIKDDPDDVDQKKTLEELAAELGGTDDPDLLSLSGSSSDNTQKPRITQVISLCGMDDEGNLLQHANDKIDSVELEMARILGEDLEPYVSAQRLLSKPTIASDKNSNEEGVNLNKENLKEKSLEENSTAHKPSQEDSAVDQASPSKSSQKEEPEVPSNTKLVLPEKETSEKPEVSVAEGSKTETEADNAKTETGKAKTEAEADKTNGDTESGKDKMNIEADKAQNETEADKTETETETEVGKAETETGKPETETEAEKAETETKSDKAETETEAEKGETETGKAETEADKAETEKKTDKGDTTETSSDIPSESHALKGSASQQQVEKVSDEAEGAGSDNESEPTPHENDSQPLEDTPANERRSVSPVKDVSEKHETTNEENDSNNRKESEENDVEEVELPSSGSSVVLDISSDSEADPTWAPGPDAIVVSDENDTDPDSSHEDGSPTTDDKRKTGTSKSPIKIKGKDKKEESKAPPTVAQVAKILHPDALKQILSNLTFPLNGPVALSIADGSTLSVSQRTIISKGNMLQNENSPSKFRTSRRAQISGERSRKCAKLLGLKMFEGLGKIKKVFDFSTFLSDPDDELQFKKFCLMFRECLRDVCESKNAVTNIGKLTVKISHKTMRNDSIALSQEMADAEALSRSKQDALQQDDNTESLPEVANTQSVTIKEGQQDNTDQAEMFECMTVDSNVENHYENAPSVENAIEQTIA